MVQNLIGEDIKLMRDRYDEALKLQGIPCKYQYPLMATTNEQGESVIDSLSPLQDTFIFFEGNPKVKTYKRYGWVVENDKNLPFLIYCSFNLPHVQKDSMFSIAGQYSELGERKFRVTEITYDLQCADHLVCQVIPVYDKQSVGRTKQEIKQKFNKSNTFLTDTTDYRGNYHTTKEEYGNN